MYAQKGTPKNWSAETRPLRVEALPTPYKYSPTCWAAEFGLLGQTLLALLTRSAWKMTRRVPHFKVTQGHRNRTVTRTSVS